MISFSNTSSLTSLQREEWCRQLAEILQAEYGSMWKLTVQQTTNWISPAALAGLSAEAGSKLWEKNGADKIFRLLVVEQGGEFQLTCREWDRASKSFGCHLQQATLSRRELVSVLADLIGKSFRPVIDLDVIRRDKIEGLARGGELNVSLPAEAQLQDGDFLIPFLRYLDREQNVRDVRPVPWTYLQVTRHERSRVELQLVSTFAAPLPLTRRRVQVQALPVKIRHAATRVQIFPRGNRQNPLAGARCLVRDKLPEEEKAKVQEQHEEQGQQAAPRELLSDREGIVTVTATPKQPLQWLEVFSGEALLARVPLIAGAEEFLELEVPDDRARLHVEAEVQLLAGKLIDIVATREVLIARASTAATQSRWDELDNFLRELDELPTFKQVQTQIDRLELEAVQGARDQKDRVAEVRIKRLCNSIRQSAQRYLDPLRISDFEQEMRSRRQQQQ